MLADVVKLKPPKVAAPLAGAALLWAAGGFRVKLKGALVLGASALGALLPKGAAEDPLLKLGGGAQLNAAVLVPKLPAGWFATGVLVFAAG